MKELNIVLGSSQRPKYRRLAEALRSAIREGQIAPGEELLSSREFAKRFRMHRHTVMVALGELQSEGWIESVERKSYRVTTTLPDTFLRPLRQARRKIEVAPIAESSFARGSKLAPQEAKSSFKFSFPSGYPDPRLFPRKEFKSHLDEAFRAKEVLDYGDPSGRERLRSQIQIYLRRVRDVKDREIVVTNGSQEALFLLAQILLRPGDAVAVEALGYPPAIEALRFAGAKIVPIRIDGQGLRTDDLERVLEKRKIKLLYTTPLHQYPTTVTLSAERRLRLYELAVAHGVFILEDDYDHEFHYVSQPVAPLASFDPAGRVLYVSTFSKVLFPSARLGFMAVPAAIARQVARVRRISSRENEGLMQEAIARWMESGGFERHLRRVRRSYAERREGMIASLKAVSRTGRDLSWIEPDGGMALWLDLKKNSDVFAKEARRKSILVSPESQFRFDGKSGTHLRLGFSGRTSAENDFALQNLFRRDP